MLTKCLVATVVLLLAGPAMAQGWPNTQGPSTAGPGGWHPQPVPYPSFPTYQPPQPQMPQSWTGNQIGGITTWTGSNGGSMTCNRIGTITTCN